MRESALCPLALYTGGMEFNAHAFLTAFCSRETKFCMVWGIYLMGISFGKKITRRAKNIVIYKLFTRKRYNLKKRIKHNIILCIYMYNGIYQLYLALGSTLSDLWFIYPRRTGSISHGADWPMWYDYKRSIFYTPLYRIILFQRVFLVITTSPRGINCGVNRAR